MLQLQFQRKNAFCTQLKHATPKKSEHTNTHLHFAIHSLCKHIRAHHSSPAFAKESAKKKEEKKRTPSASSEFIRLRLCEIVPFSLEAHFSFHSLTTSPFLRRCRHRLPLPTSLLLLFFVVFLTPPRCHAHTTKSYQIARSELIDKEWKWIHKTTTAAKRKINNK